VAAGCGRSLATRYFGWLFVASSTEHSVAIADLASFRRTGSIALPQAPAQVLRAGNRVFVTCPEAHAIFEIDTAHHQLAGKIGIPGRLVSAAPVPGHDNWIAAAVDESPALVVFDTVAKRVIRRVSLPSAPGVMDVNAGSAAVASASDGAITRVSLNDGKVSGTTPVGSHCSALRFRSDGEAILAGLTDVKQVATVDSGSGALLARMPLPFAPAQFCFNPDGGQMFVTGSAEDSIAIVSAYQSQVDQTIVAGRTPSGMAVADSRNLLLVTNPASGDLTILDIETRRLAASVHVGGNPGEVLLTPDGEYALVVSRDSGDVSVVRLNTVLDRKIKTKPLFTVFPMAAAPSSAAIIPKES